MSGIEKESKNELPRVPLRKAIRSLCELAQSRLVRPRNLREDVCAQIGNDVVMLKVGAAAISANATSFVAIHDDVFLKALRRLTGMVRLSMNSEASAAATPEDRALLEDLHTIDTILGENHLEFPTPESRAARWREP